MLAAVDHVQLAVRPGAEDRPVGNRIEFLEEV